MLEEMRRSLSPSDTPLLLHVKVVRAAASRGRSVDSLRQTAQTGDQTGAVNNKDAINATEYCGINYDLQDQSVFDREGSCDNVQLETVRKFIHLTTRTVTIRQLKEEIIERHRKIYKENLELVDLTNESSCDFDDDYLAACVLESGSIVHATVSSPEPFEDRSFDIQQQDDDFTTSTPVDATNHVRRWLDSSVCDGKSDRLARSSPMVNLPVLTPDSAPLNPKKLRPRKVSAPLPLRLDEDVPTGFKTPGSGRSLSFKYDRTPSLTLPKDSQNPRLILPPCTSSPAEPTLDVDPRKHSSSMPPTDPPLSASLTPKFDSSMVANDAEQKEIDREEEEDEELLAAARDYFDTSAAPSIPSEDSGSEISDREGENASGAKPTGSIFSADRLMGAHLLSDAGSRLQDLPSGQDPVKSQGDSAGDSLMDLTDSQESLLSRTERAYSGNLGARAGNGVIAGILGKAKPPVRDAEPRSSPEFGRERLSRPETFTDGILKKRCHGSRDDISINRTVNNPSARQYILAKRTKVGSENEPFTSAQLRPKSVGAQLEAEYEGPSFEESRTLERLPWLDIKINRKGSRSGKDTL
ncbi:hypothetical protein BZA70DRAFT_272550 [Myxozyma melibiosi]|uniref:Nucleolar protein Dnt1-like N-terminal domain-containing protein n=1 Tax=Myxozyma melibiosi TaxID=54550 RepID=A0ABR1FDK5_9ASCO